MKLDGEVTPAHLKWFVVLVAVILGYHLPGMF